jgi:hypothetical protein
MECEIVAIKFKTVGVLSVSANSALFCSAPALLYSDLLLLCSALFLI